MSSIRSSYAALVDLPTHYAGAAGHWLSQAEFQLWQEMRSPQRRATFLGGRIVAKRLLKSFLAHAGHDVPSSAALHIESSGGGRGQRPTAWIGARRFDRSLSIAHTARGVLVAIAAENVALGVDLVSPECVDSRSLSWCFTPAERDWLASRPERGGAEQLWAMKEALYKACQQGEGFAPQQIEVVPEPCYPLLDASRAVRFVQSWRVDGQLAALAVVEPAATRCESFQLNG